MSSSTASLFCLLLLGLPLLGAILNALLGPALGRRFVNLVGTLSVLAAFAVALVVLIQLLGADAAHRSVTSTVWNWIDLGGSSGGFSVDLSFTLDPLASVMILVITGVGFLIHVYATGYMADDPTPHRFFAYMNFFITAMLLLVLAANLVFLIVGWALVALASYLLIGYYYDRPSAVLAARKAFITQVIGDVALVIAAFMLVVSTHTLQLTTATGSSARGIFELAPGTFTPGSAFITGICVLLAVGAFAKSAQFPLHTWLPDAMEGPTPVSALIHAATMVTAGVYLVARFHPLFDLSPFAEGVVAVVGMGTALMAGVAALGQTDIKRVIAYSTMSQIGLMIFAVGIGAYTAGMYHFVTHSIFKALLFMAAGNVIHALHDEQDIGHMGGLSSTMRRTELCFLSGSFALAGILPFAGWFSKENLLGFGLASGPVGIAPVLYGVGLLINVLTGVYAFRLYFRVFRGTPERAQGWSAHEPPASMLVPVAILGVLSAVAGLALLWPWPGSPVHLFTDFLRPVFEATGAGTVPSGQEPALNTALAGLVGGTIASLLGVGIASALWYRRSQSALQLARRMPPSLQQLSLRGFYFDELYNTLLVRPVVSLARSARRVVEPRVMDGWVRGVGDTAGYFGQVARDFQSGLLRDYATVMLLGVAFCGGLLAWVLRGGG